MHQHGSSAAGFDFGGLECVQRLSVGFAFDRGALEADAAAGKHCRHLTGSHCQPATVGQVAGYTQTGSRHIALRALHPDRP
ncbi:hypothetical protein [Streptomyces cucumeris]|uniref:hypothetical protein n=1 Tax=Streptomyces cucumeris TaxID=2962890 RepID=UPI003D710BE5